MDLRNQIEQLRLEQKKQEETITYLSNVNEELAMKIDTIKWKITKNRVSSEITNFRISQHREQMQNYKEELNEANTLDKMENDEDDGKKTNDDIQKLATILEQKENTIKSMSEDISKIKADCISIEKDKIKNREEKMKKIEELRQKIKGKK